MKVRMYEDYNDYDCDYEGIQFHDAVGLVIRGFKTNQKIAYCVVQAIDEMGELDGWGPGSNSDFLSFIDRKWKTIVSYVDEEDRQEVYDVLSRSPYAAK